MAKSSTSVTKVGCLACCGSLCAIFICCIAILVYLGSQGPKTPSTVNSSVALQDGEALKKLLGFWKTIEYQDAGRIESGMFHSSWEFLSNNRVKIGIPEYKELPANTMEHNIQYLTDNRFQVYNVAGGRRINLFSGKWSLENHNLVLMFNVSERLPSSDAAPTDVEVTLKLIKTEK